MENTLCVVGLGHVGLPLAIEFDREELDVIGYDVHPDVVSQLESGVDPTNELGDSAIERSSISPTSEVALR